MSIPDRGSSSHEAEEAKEPGWWRRNEEGSVAGWGWDH
jgi:hypothetical protein